MKIKKIKEVVFSEEESSMRENCYERYLYFVCPEENVCLTERERISLNTEACVIEYFTLCLTERAGEVSVSLSPTVNLDGIMTDTDIRDTDLAKEEISLLLEQANHCLNEKLFTSMADGEYAVLQMDEGMVQWEEYAYMSYRRDKDRIHSGLYRCVYKDRVENAEEHLDDIYCALQGVRPDGYTGTSLSVSDIILTKTRGKLSAYYVDTFGFQKLPQDFLTGKEDEV
jgi:hypothetical protein